jgi:diacylglycerol kinase family enzyme
VITLLRVPISLAYDGCLTVQNNSAFDQAKEGILKSISHSTHKLIVVYNPHSGGAHLIDDIKKAFADHGADPTYIPIASKQLRRAIQASQNGTLTIVVAGGDGTINSVVAQLQGKKCKLGIIPTGTLNNFAKTLHIPLDVPDAVATILQGTHCLVDVGLVNNHVFVNNSSIGFYPRSLRTRDAYSQHIGKWPAAFLGFARAIIRPRHYRVIIVIDGKPQTLRTPFVFVGNNEYKRAQPDFGDRPTLDSGQLAIYVIKATKPLAIIRTFAHALITKKRRTKDFAVYLADNCTIHTRHHRKIHIACDGEVLTAKTPLHYRSAPQSLRVIAPVRSAAKKHREDLSHQ